MRAAKMLSSDNQQFDQIFKLVLIGDSGVGKSCLIKQFTEESFVEQGTTVGKLQCNVINPHCCIILKIFRSGSTCSGQTG